MSTFRVVKTVAIVVVSAGVLSACGRTSLSPEGAFEDVAYRVSDRTGKRIEWDAGSPDDLQAREHISRLLSRRLSASSAVQIALLNNKTLQSSYASLGVAQADLVQAGLLTNPVVDGSAVWPYSPERLAANITIGVVFNFIELFWRRYKEAVAESQLEEAKIMISGMVIDHAAKTNRAFIDYVAARQEAGLLGEVVDSARANVAAAKAIREAGNSTPLDFETQQAVLTQAKLDLANAEVASVSAREKLNVLMGLSGGQTNWRAPSALPTAKSRLAGMGNIEAAAVEKSLNLAELRQKIITLGYQHQLTNRKSLIPDIGLGIEWEKNEGGKEIGPLFDVTVPLFDRGEAKRARGIMQIRQAQDAYWAMAIKVRSTARLVKVALATTLKTARYYERAVLPQQRRLLQATQQQYNAMQEDVFRLIRTKSGQIQANRGYIGVLRSYWQARTDYQQLMSGRLPDDAGGGSMTVAASGGGAAEGGH